MPISSQETANVRAQGASLTPEPHAVTDEGTLVARLLATIRDHWRTLAVVMLAVLAPAIVWNRIELPFDVSFGYRSFARNVAIALTLGVWMGARGLPWPRSPLTVPMFAFALATFLSVAVNDGRWADVRSTGVALGLFFGVRALSSDPSGRAIVFHWLGGLVVLTMVTEVLGNPAILQFRESLRDSLVTAHPNTLGAFFAVVSPLFLGALDTKSARRAAPLYFGCAVLGATLTFSRLALAGIFVGSAVAMFFRARPRHPRRAAAVGFGVALLVAATILYLSLGRSEADWQRLRIIYASLTLFSEHWLFGVGWGVENLGAVFPGRYEELFGTPLWLHHSHNMYVDVLVASGLVGGLAALWFFSQLVRVAARGVRESSEDGSAARVASGFAATVAVFLLLGVGDMPLYHERLLFPIAALWGLLDGWVGRQTRPS